MSFVRSSRDRSLPQTYTHTHTQDGAATAHQSPSSAVRARDRMCATPTTPTHASARQSKQSSCVSNLAKFYTPPRFNHSKNRVTTAERNKNIPLKLTTRSFCCTRLPPSRGRIGKDVSWQPQISTYSARVPYISNGSWCQLSEFQDQQVADFQAVR